MAKTLIVRQVGRSLMIAIPKTFAEVIGIKVGTKLELDITKKDNMSLKVLYL